MYFVCQEKQWFWPKALWFCEGLWANQETVLSAKNCVFHPSRILKHCFFWPSKDGCEVHASWFLTWENSNGSVLQLLVSHSNWSNQKQSELWLAKIVTRAKDCKQLGLWISDIPFLGPFIACQTWWHHTIESTSLVGWKSTKQYIYIISYGLNYVCLIYKAIIYIWLDYDYLFVVLDMNFSGVIGPSDPQLPVYLDADPGDVPLIPRWSRQGTQTSQTHTTYFAWILEKVYVTTSHLALV